MNQRAFKNLGTAHRRQNGQMIEYLEVFVPSAKELASMEVSQAIGIRYAEVPIATYVPPVAAVAPEVDDDSARVELPGVEQTAPGHTDLMVAPEVLDELLASHPPSVVGAEHVPPRPQPAPAKSQSKKQHSKHR